MPWSQETWMAAINAYRSGWRPPEVRFPIVIRPGSYVSSPQVLQQLADLPSVPEVTTTTITGWGSQTEGINKDGSPPEEVQICDVSFDQLKLIEERVEYERILVWFQHTRRFAVLVSSLKEGYALEQPSTSGNPETKS